MNEQSFEDRIAQKIVARLLPYIEKINGNENGPIIAQRLLTVGDLTRYLGRKSPRSVYHMVSRREIPFVKQGRTLRFDKLVIDRWIRKKSKKK